MGSTTIYPGDPSVSYTAAPCNGPNGLYCTGDMIINNPIGAPGVTITVNAFGSPDYSVYPQMEVLLNGQLLGTWNVTGTSQNYSVTIPATAIQYYFADAIGSARAVADSSGNTCFNADYYPYGRENDYNASCSPTHKFTGKERDTETGNDYFGARYYGSSLGRFMSPDPVGGHQEDPQTLNKYSYVRNNPLSLTDPTGLDLNLNCDKNNGTTCQGGHVYYKDQNGKYQETVIKSDDEGNLIDQSGNKYSGTVDASGVHFAENGSKTSYTGSWVDNSNDTKFTQTTGALAGFSFDFSEPGKGQSFSGTFKAATNFYGVKSALEKAGLSVSYLDEAFNFYEMAHNWSLVNFRSPGDPNTGQNSVHFLVDPGDKVGLVVPTTGKLHGFETNPQVAPWEHLKRDVPW